MIKLIDDCDTDEDYDQIIDHCTNNKKRRGYELILIKK